MPATLPPADLAAERALLSEVLTHGDACPPAVWTLKPSDWYDPRHADAWTALLAARSRWQSPTVAALPDALLVYACGLAFDPGWPLRRLPTLARRIRRHAATRRLLDHAHKLLVAGYDGDLAAVRDHHTAIGAALGVANA
ncbi:MAG: hypothetical protein FJ100_23245 [Deltaproteobacteria bacterium]|nr:hypothetical protein [Deltaproteobacteria bacterium]